MSSDIDGRKTGQVVLEMYGIVGENCVYASPSVAVQGWWRFNVASNGVGGWLEALPVGSNNCF